MALFSFFRHRTPRKFDHKPIYWNPDKERLQRRIAEVKRKLQESGELPLDAAEDSPHIQAEQIRDYDSTRIRGTLVDGTTHTKRRLQMRTAGKTDRTSRIVKFVLGIIAAAVIIWILRTRFQVFI